jgi:adenylate cyclase
LLGFRALAGRIRRAWEPDWPTTIAGIVMVLALVGVQAWSPPLVEDFQLRVFDQYLRWSPRPTPEQSPVVIVDIDDESLRQLGQWPWPRTLLAQLVDSLTQAGVAALGFDIILAEPDRLSPPVYAESLSLADPEMAAALRDLADHDQMLAAAMTRSRVVLGLSGLARELGGAREPLPAYLTFAELGSDPRPMLTFFRDSVRSLPVLEAAAAGTGVVTVTPEHDGLVRRVPLIANIGGKLVPTLAVEMLRVATGQRTAVVRSSPTGIEALILQGVAIPTDRHGLAFVHYSERRPDLYVSAAAVLKGEVGRERLAGRLALIGTSAAGLGDIKATPVAGNMPGVEVHAQLLETILFNDHISRPATAVGAERVLLLTLGILLALVGPTVPAALLPPILLLVLGTSLGTSWLAFSRYAVLVDGAYPAVGATMVILWLALARYVREQTQRRRVRSAFSHYLSPVMVERLSRNRGLVRLGGERRVLTVLFSDIRDFTTLSEQFTDEPERLTQLLNRYLTEMSTSVLAYGGTIDKYIGDALMAFWNAPLEQPQHALSACLAALDMRKRLHSFNVELGKEYAARGMPFTPIEMGIGINSGPCFVGNLGSEQRFSYSVLGDTVNVASRLEGQTKVYGVRSVVGEATQAMVRQLATLPLDSILLKGKTEPVLVYGLVGNAEDAGDERFQRLRADHLELFRTMQDGRPEEAERWLARCRAHQVSFGMAPFYRYCQQRLAEGHRGGPLKVAPTTALGV